MGFSTYIAKAKKNLFKGCSQLSMCYLRAENFLFNLLKCIFSITEPITNIFIVKLEMENYKYF